MTDFDTFWLLWAGKRVEKKLCRRNWAHLTGDQMMAAIVAAAAWRPIWLREDDRYLPQPVRWITGERWEDELPRAALGGSSAFVPFASTRDM